jgi:hypothetical protein
VQPLLQALEKDDPFADGDLQSAAAKKIKKVNKITPRFSKDILRKQYLIT